MYVYVCVRAGVLRVHVCVRVRVCVNIDVDRRSEARTFSPTQWEMERIGKLSTEVQRKREKSFQTGDTEWSFVPCEHVYNPSVHNPSHWHQYHIVTAEELSSQLRGENMKPLKPLESE